MLQFTFGSPRDSSSHQNTISNYVQMVNFRGYIAESETDRWIWLVTEWLWKTMSKRLDWDIRETQNLLNRASVFCQIPDRVYEGITTEPTYSVKERFLARKINLMATTNFILFKFFSIVYEVQEM